MQCLACDGKGKIDSGLNITQCTICKGTGRVKELTTEWDKKTILHEYLEEANELFAKRNAEYGSDFAEHDPAMAAFFPNGVELTTPIDFRRYGMVCAIVDKLVRYCKNFENGHMDSIKDAAVYCHMLTHVDTTKEIK